MNSVIFSPLEEYSKKLRELHRDRTSAFFEKLVERSGVDVEENRKTVASYNELTESISALRKKLSLLRFLRVLMCITLILIPLVVLKTTPKIKALREEIGASDKKAEELLREAERQMLPLNSLFTDKDALRLIDETVPLIDFDEHFSVKKEADMKLNYDFSDSESLDESTLSVLSGSYNENPFLFENKLVHRLGTEIYHGYKTIHWSETYRDSNGKLRTRRRSETLHATVEKPKPFYSTQVVLNYCAQGAPDLSFTRDATHLDKMSEREIDRYVKRGEKRLKRKTDKAIKRGSSFTSMSNTDFEVLFDALDRSDEVQFRTLFTPLAQTNMVDLLLSKEGYGDDFHFIKRRRTNKIISKHSQGRGLFLPAGAYISYSFDIIRENFSLKNAEFFRAVYFDLAPILAIPIYQERPVHSLKPIPSSSQLYSLKECESLANAISSRHVVHPDTKTEAILKSSFVGSENGIDETEVSAYSYDIEKRTDFVTVFGGDGRFHSVPVPWDEYIPLEEHKSFFVGATEKAKNENVFASQNGLCIFN